MLISWLRIRLISIKLVRFVRIQFDYLIHIKPNLRRQLNQKQVNGHIKKDGPRILVPLIETSHYQYYQVLAFAKALELRGAKIKLLLCGSCLNGCEIKNMHRVLDPCFSCCFNAKNIVPLFNFDTVRLSEYITNEKISGIKVICRKYTSMWQLQHGL